jgi:hypothetical protein
MRSITVLGIIRQATPVHHADLGSRKSVTPTQKVTWSQVLRER